MYTCMYSEKEDCRSYLQVLNVGEVSLDSVDNGLGTFREFLFVVDQKDKHQTSHIRST